MTHQEAIEAAHAAICEESLKDCLDPDWRGKCVRAVEAAAPYLRAQALDALAQQAYEEWRAADDDELRNGKAAIAGHAEDWLRARAVTERGEG